MAVRISVMFLEEYSVYQVTQDSQVISQFSTAEEANNYALKVAQAFFSQTRHQILLTMLPEGKDPNSTIQKKGPADENE